MIQGFFKFMRKRMPKIHKRILKQEIDKLHKEMETTGLYGKKYQKLKMLESEYIMVNDK